MKLKAYAKINLFLEVSDYIFPLHQLHSLMAKINLYDEIEIILAQEFSLEIIGPYGKLIDSKNNLITKAFYSIEKEFSINNKFCVKLTKNIPVSAGLGGGSSNVATIILALNKIFKLDLSKEKLREIGFKIGSDVPFFLENNPTLVEGGGEKIKSSCFEFSKLNLLIINPNQELLTKDVFLNFKKNFLQKKEFQESKKQNIFQYLKDHKNDLELSAIQLMPEIKTILQIIEKQNDCILARMSGSGATCFGVFKSKESLQNAYNNLKKLWGNYFIIKSEIIN
jgi:4-diphosphocytidyl-2-C-methyl-D-erythritol kinase